MNLRINLKTPIPYPSALASDPKYRYLARRLDEDRIFRWATVLAAMRAVAPMNPGYHPDHYSGWESLSWFDYRFGSVDYPPLFETSDAASVDPGVALGALFEWDGGQSEVVMAQPKALGKDFSRGAIAPGRTVFSFVNDLPPRENCGAYASVENGARVAEVHSCLASHYPHIHWWRAFNAAVHLLTTEYPSASNEMFTVWPYRLDKLPGKTPSEEIFKGITQGWTYHLKGYCAKNGIAEPSDDERETFLADHAGDIAEGRVIVPEGAFWLVTPADISQQGLFRNDVPDELENRDMLRRQWLSWASEIGFEKFSNQPSTGVPDVRFVDALGDYWLCDTPAKFKNGMLSQLWESWRGHPEVWRDELPMHGYAAMIAYLKYFEEANGGFGVTSDKWDDHFDEQHRTITQDVWTKLTPLKDGSEIVVPFGQVSTYDEPAAIVPLESGAAEIDRRETVAEAAAHFGKAEVSWRLQESEFDNVFANLTLRLPFTATVPAVDGLTYETTVTDEDDFYYGYIGGDADAFANHLMGLLKKNYVNGLRFRASGAAARRVRVETTVPEAVQWISNGEKTSPANFDIFEELKPLCTPLVWAETNEPAILLTEYWFLRTSYSCGIFERKEDEPKVITRLAEEAGVSMETWLPENLESMESFSGGVGFYFSSGFWEDFYFTVDKYWSDYYKLKINVALPGATPYTVEYPLPRIYLMGNEVFPGVCGYLGSSADISPGDATFSTPTTPRGVKMDGASSRVETFHDFAFLRYPRNIVMPHFLE